MSIEILVCPECGAQSVNGLNCWEKLGQILAWEWRDPELMAVHFLTVATYNLQHPAQFTDEAISNLKEVYIAHLDAGLALEEIRHRVGTAASGKTKVLKPVSERQPLLKEWSKTINSVYLPGKPEGAAERVKAWAKSVRQEM